MNEINALPTAPQPSPVPQETALEARYSELCARAKEHNPAADLDLLRAAFDTARTAHAGQTRASGEPYIFHPVEVATILTAFRMDVPTLAAALLHDVIEDTGTTRQQLADRFGPEIANLVDGVTKLSAISERGGKDDRAAPDAPLPESVSRERARTDAQVENLRRIFLAVAKDVRVIMIKLADRLHNLRTIGAVSPARQRARATETLEIFAPLAQRLGLGRLYPELEDLSFRYLHPEEYERLSAQVDKVRAERELIIPEVIDALERKLKELGIHARIGWRTKHLYSVWRKMRGSSKELDEVWDLIAFRIIVDTQEECYTALGAVHALWPPLKDRIKDYVAVPKSNRYQSLHTTVYGPKNQPLEIQIRTQEMQRINEYGISAHWAYKQGKGGQTSLAQDIYPWIKLLLDWQDESKDAREYAEHLKLDILASEVFVFTPRGDVIDLPAGSTPLDFAYRVHTDVGHRCVGAKVNAKMVALDYRLQNADIVDVITSKNGTPSLDWLRVCQSSHARNKIRAWYKKERRDENIIRGKDLLARELKRQRAADNVAGDHDLLGKLATTMNFMTVDDLLAAVGYSEVGAPQLVLKLKEAAPDRFPQPKPKVTSTVSKRKTKQAVSVTGMQNLLVKLSRCCSPVLGDDIGGFVSQGRGVIVHRVSCRNFEAQIVESPERRIEVKWEKADGQPTYAADLDISAMNRDGLVIDIMGLLNEAKIPTRSCRAQARKDRATVKLSVDIVHRQQLEDLMKRLGRLKGVLSVDRSTTH
ncbi:MAG: bifunctional (p)ppGpp synthetase/guanosine-3',5'-bis(diphosphate) 3'-pyrophosphohydrolase [Proteobacteria bacterium]|nr:bifunctional (p)ppGpp synthetase/guanosine-3',5'-bis(diphosphate) 3'-pyrophosphohydrolase [Pseudomonadota bacterium]